MANVTERKGATKVPVQKNSLSNWGVNRITQYIMFFGSLFTFFTFTDSQVATAVAAVFAVGGFVATIYEKAKNGIVADWSAWIKNPNTWSNLTAILVGLLPALSPDAVKFLQNLIEGLVAGNWQQAITAAFSLVSILIFFFRGQVAKA